MEIKEDYVEESSSEGESELGRFSSFFPSITWIYCKICNLLFS